MYWIFSYLFNIYKFYCIILSKNTIFRLRFLLKTTAGKEMIRNSKSFLTHKLYKISFNFIKIRSDDKNVFLPTFLIKSVKIIDDHLSAIILMDFNQNYFWSTIIKLSTINISD
jgi:hypothetical protein